MNISSETHVNVPGDFVDGFSPWFGYGKVDAPKAVAKAIKMLPKSEIVRIDSDETLQIPDNNRTGIKSTIDITKQGVIQEIRISVDITHTYIGDLKVELFTPWQERIILHNHSGYWADNIKKTYSENEIPKLGSLRGRDCKGIWALNVMDAVGLDTGTLNRWEIKTKLV